MSTSPQAFASTLQIPRPPQDQKVNAPASTSLRPRQSTPDQARALQVITHAIEYLLDSRLFDAWQSASDAAAVHILMACSRQVFQQCDVLDARPNRVPVKRVHSLRLEPRAAAL